MRSLLVLAAAAATAHAQPAPPPIAQAGVDERPGAQVPLDTPFTAAPGASATLRSLGGGTRPVLLVLAYARCTMLCSLVLRGVADAAHRMPLQPGRDYELVLIGLDARETIDEASRKQAALVEQLGREGARWPYLIGPRASIDAIARAVGFRYAWDARTEQYAHPAVIFALTPDGRVSRYLHGVQFDPAEVASALDDAGAGRVQSPRAAEVLRCFRFDPASRRVGARAQLALRIGAAIVALGMLCGLAAVIAHARRTR